MCFPCITGQISWMVHMRREFANHRNFGSCHHARCVQKQAIGIVLCMYCSLLFDAQLKKPFFCHGLLWIDSSKIHISMNTSKVTHNKTTKRRYQWVQCHTGLILKILCSKLWRKNQVNKPIICNLVALRHAFSTSIFYSGYNIVS